MTSSSILVDHVLDLFYLWKPVAASRSKSHNRFETESLNFGSELEIA
jgi:hypothetical protein